MEDEPTSPESHDMTKDEVLKTISEMAPCIEMHGEFKIAEITPTSEVEECIVRLCKEMEATIVNKKKIENKKIVIFEDYVLKLLIKHNYHLLRKNGGKNYQHIHS